MITESLKNQKQDLYFFKCSVCGNDSFKRIYRGLSVLEERTYYVCTNCGTVCLNPRMGEKGCEEYYQTQYYGKSQPEVPVDKDYDGIKPDSMAAQTFNDLQGYLSKTAKIIEIGCGQGENLIVLKENGFNDLTGLELSTGCCRRLQNFYDINCVNKSLASYFLESGAGEKFDCVILSHVLEHFVEPEKALGMISGIMEPEGVMYIRIPDFYGFSNPYAQFGRSHTLYFSQVSLQMILHNTGFIVDRYFESPVDEVVLIAKKTPKKLPAITENRIEYERVLSYLKKYKLEYFRNTITRILGRFMLKVFGERIYSAVRDFLRKLKLF